MTYDVQGAVTPDATAFPDLNTLLVELVERARDVLGDNLVGAYLVGSFAVGDADLHSDCDFEIVTSRPLDDAQWRGVRRIHDEIPTRSDHWAGHLEGSYPVASELRAAGDSPFRWPFVDHGSRLVELDDHCDRPWMRWSLREHGVTLVGPPPATLVDRVPAAVLRNAARATLPTLVEDIHAWMPRDIAWGQRYVVTSACRSLYTVRTAEVTSKKHALAWAEEVVDDRWHQLLRQVDADRGPFDRDERPAPGSLESAHAFAAYVAEIA